MSAEFCPCPFCEGTNLYPTSSGHTEHFIECGDCGASGPVHESDEAAWQGWNAGRDSATPGSPL
jgi:hypothetical protein